MNPDVIFEVSDFVAVFNQTIEYAYPHVTLVGELANLKVSKGRWLYFDVKDEQASVRFFGTVYQLPGPLEDGMRLQVRGTPRLHPQFGFSISIQSIKPVGEGTIKRASDLLKAKLQAEGLFDIERKRSLPYPPKRIGLIASGESAAYADFVKILNQRWGGVEILHRDVQVQGEAAPQQIVDAFNRLTTEPDLDVIVLIRGGGSADDLQSFSVEQVVRAVAASRVPVLAAIGHEVDISLAELVADVHASTPSNAAERLVPEKQATQALIAKELLNIRHRVESRIYRENQLLLQHRGQLTGQIQRCLDSHRSDIALRRQVLHGYDPKRILATGYALVAQSGKQLRSISGIKGGDNIQVRLQDGRIHAIVTDVQKV